MSYKKSYPHGNKQSTDTTNKKNLLEKLGVIKKKEHIDTPYIEEDKVDYKFLYRQKSKELERQKKMTSKAESSLKEVEGQLKTVQLEFSDKKKEYFDLQTSLQESEKLIQSLQKNIKQEEERYATLDKKYQFVLVEKNKLSQHFSSMKQKLESSRQSQDSIKRASSRLRAKQQTKNEEVERYKKIISSKDKRLHSLENAIKELKIEKEKVFDLKPSVMIEFLMEEMSHKNFYEYKEIPKLFKEYKLTRSSFDLAENSDVKRDDLNCETQFGYIVKFPYSEENAFHFTNTNGESFLIDGKSRPNMKAGEPASAIINKDTKTAFISYVYHTGEEMEYDQKETRFRNHVKKQKASLTEENYPYIAPISALLITSKNGVRYRDRLLKHVVKAEWIDPYEKSVIHIRNKLSSVDIAFFLEDAMPHDMRPLIDEYREIDKDKVQTMYDHNEEAIFARTRYVALKKGWMNFSDSEVAASRSF